MLRNVLDNDLRNIVIPRYAFSEGCIVCHHRWLPVGMTKGKHENQDIFRLYIVSRGASMSVVWSSRFYQRVHRITRCRSTRCCGTVASSHLNHHLSREITVEFGHTIFDPEILARRDVFTPSENTMSIFAVRPTPRIGINLPVTSWLVSRRFRCRSGWIDLANGSGEEGDDEREPPISPPTHPRLASEFVTGIDTGC